MNPPKPNHTNSYKDKDNDNKDKLILKIEKDGKRKYPLPQIIFQLR